jgi:hypothetical protein
MALDVPKRIDFLMDIARGMVALHGCNPAIIHRDLKPAVSRRPPWPAPCSHCLPTALAPSVAPVPLVPSVGPVPCQPPLQHSKQLGMAD